MKIKDEDYFKHVGVLGMKWGHHKRQEKSISNGPKSKPKPESSNIEEVAKKNAEILKKNPDAAVVNYDILKHKTNDEVSQEELDAQIAKRKKIRNIAIGVGLGLTIAAGTILYATHKDQVDGAFKKAFEKIGNKKVEELKPGELSKIEIKKYKKLGLKGVDTQQEAVNANWIASWSGHDTHRYDAISDEAFNSFDDNDISLKPGQIIKRITKNGNEVLRDAAYVSFDEDDNNRYAAFLPAMWKVNQKLPTKPKVYSMSMEALEEIKSPSKKKRVEMLAELIEKDYFTKFMLEPNSKTDLKGKEEALALAKKHYNKVATDLCNRDGPLTQRYLDLVKSHGYNALVDDNDAGRLTKTPLILLKASAVSSKGIKPLSSLDILNAVNKVKPMEGESLEKSVDIFESSTDFMTKLIQKVGTRTYYDALYGE